ncbi:hypothetical protein F5Y13DRAFT_187404 [Hypoxylon sp. FL1857]|nr:hypothetical protein F5Y13DRAFT_187404 [Hypoxylon sp. FL1857]
MATAVTASPPQGDLEKGLGPGATRTARYIRDITYRVIPFCVAVLIIFSVGIVVVSTLHFDQPIPHEGTLVVSILLAVLFFLFCIGVVYLYKKKHYPPLTQAPDAPDFTPQQGNRKKLFPRASTLFIDNLRVNKLFHHHEIKPEVNSRGTLNNPAELESPNPANVSRPGNHQPHVPRATRQTSTLPTSNAAGSKHPPDKRLRPQGPRQQPYVSPRKRKPYTPSRDSILEEPEEDGPPRPSIRVLSPAYMPDSQQHSSRRNTWAAGGDREVSPAAVSPHHTRITGQRGKPYLTTPSSPRAPINTGAANNQHIPALRASPEPVRLSVDEADPLAHFVHIPEYINSQAFTGGLPEKLAGNCLYIFNDLPTLPNHELEAAEFGGECYYYVEEPKHRVHERKSNATQFYTHMPKRPPTHDSGYSEGIFSFIDSSLERPTQVVYPREPIARRPVVRSAVHRVEGGRKTRDVSNDKGSPKELTSASAPRHLHTEPERRKADERQHKTSIGQNRSRSKAPDPSNTSLYPAPLKLPLRTKPPTRKGSEIREIPAEEGRQNLIDSRPRTKYETKEVKEKSLNRKRGVRQLTQDRSRMADTAPDEQNASTPAEQAWPNVHGPRLNQTPPAVPPRSSSRFHEHIAGSCGTVSEETTGVASD